LLARSHPIALVPCACPAPLAASAYNHGETYSALRSALAGDWPDLQLFPILLPVAPDGQFALVAFATAVASRGTVRLGVACPLAAPLVDPRFLAEPADLDRLEAGVGIIRDVIASSAMTRLGVSETRPGPGIRDSAALRDWIRHTISSYWHPAGTCRLGTSADEGAVVDPELRVHGITGLRMADASVMPLIPNVPLNTTVCAIAEKAAALIAGGS
jgi:choline dehydrogenase